MTVFIRKRLPDLEPGQPAYVSQNIRGWAIIKSLIRYPNVIEAIYLGGNWDEETPFPAVIGKTIKLTNVDPSLTIIPLAWGEPLPVAPLQSATAQEADAVWAKVYRDHSLGRKLPAATDTK
jgi:hypothetical protein